MKNSKEYSKSYYEKNKDKIIKRMTEKIHCDACNKDISKINLSKHNSTEKHKLLSRLQNYD